VRDTLEDNVSLPKIVMAWLSPPLFAPGDAELDLVASIATTGKASRLYKDLVYDQRIAQSVHAYQRSLQLRSWFVVEAVARKGVSLDALEQAIDAQLDRLRAEPATEAELLRAKNEYEMRLVAQLQTLSERASMLGAYQAFVGDPGYVMEDLLRYRRATRETVRRAVQQTLRPDARVILRIVPYGAAARQPQPRSAAGDRAAEAG
jgi:zinc protease